MDRGDFDVGLARHDGAFDHTQESPGGAAKINNLQRLRLDHCPDRFGDKGTH